MNSLTDKSPFEVGHALEDLWYVPHRRLSTRVAATEAMQVAEWIAGGGRQSEQPGERELFLALHTCAYRARRRIQGPQGPGVGQGAWLDHWHQIREYIVEKNLGLVYSMMSRFRSSGLDEDDLVSDGMLALARAVNRFNPWKGYQFSTYACNVIVRALMRRGKREGNQRRRSPARVGLPLDAAHDLPDWRAELRVERLTRALDGNLGRLTELESRIVAHRFPHNGIPRLTLRQIGDAIGLSEERVRQIQKAALGKLRNVLVADPVLQ